MLDKLQILLQSGAGVTKYRNYYKIGSTRILNCVNPNQKCVSS